VQKNITLSAEESLIRKARHKAQSENTTLNSRFRQWLEWYVGANRVAEDYIQLMQNLDYVDSGKNFSRDEFNER